MTHEEEIIEEEVPQKATPEASEKTEKEVIDIEEGIYEISLDQLVPHRLLGGEMRDPNKFKELVEDIKKHGLNQPPLVNPIDKDKFEIVAGYNRYLAFKEIGESKTIQAIVKIMSEQESAERCFIDNILHQKLPPYLYEDYVNILYSTGKYKKQEELAEKLQKSDTWIRKNLKAYEIRREILGDTHDELFKELSTDIIYNADMIRKHGVDLQGLIQFLKLVRKKDWKAKKIEKEIEKYAKKTAEKQYQYLYGNKKTDSGKDNKSADTNDDKTGNQSDEENIVKKLLENVSTNLQPELKKMNDKEQQKALHYLNQIINVISKALYKYKAINQEQLNAITEVTSANIDILKNQRE